MDIDKHPCFSEGAKHKYGRIHLPVAPLCNIQCNFCNRKYDCINESRPGVTSSVLTPRQAVDYLDEVMRRIDNLSVTGIAGPGDPFANPDETLVTMRRVRERFPGMLLCVASNGLDVARYVQDLASLDVSHVTITLNAVDPLIGEKIYSWVRFEKRVYRGREAAELLLHQQLEAILLLKEHGITVKINTVVIPGINDHHLADIAKKAAVLGADIQNCMGLVHVEDTAFADIVPPTREKIVKLRKGAAKFIPQMSHCQRCRADAVGKLGEAQPEEIQQLLHRASLSKVSSDRPYVAVASMEGLFVNRHLGEAASLWIYGLSDGRARLIELRPVPQSGGGIERWTEMAALLGDCSTVLVSGVGRNPQMVLEAADIHVIAMEGLASEAVEAVLNGKEIPKIMLNVPGLCGSGVVCSGTGGGCG